MVKIRGKNTPQSQSYKHKGHKAAKSLAYFMTQETCIGWAMLVV